jgi:hypothetical protein
MKNYTDINVASINLGTLEPESDYYISKISPAIVFSTPKMKLASIDELHRKDRYKLEAEFLLYKADFYEKLLEIDNYVLDTILSNSEKWFGVKLNKDTLDMLFRRNIRLPKKLTSTPVLELNVDTNVCKVMDKTDHKIDFIELREDYEVSFVISVGAINFHKNKYNLVYDVQEIKIHNYFCPTSEYMLEDEEEIVVSDGSSEADYINTIRR